MILTSCIHLTAMRRVGPVLRLPYLMPFRISLSVRLGSWGQESGWHISPSVTSASFQNSFSDAWLSGVSRYCHSSASEHVYVREPAVSSAPLSRSQPRSSGLEECCQDKSVSFITPVAEHFCHQNFASQAVAAQALLMFSSLHCTICSVPLVQPVPSVLNCRATSRTRCANIALPRAGRPHTVHAGATMSRLM